MDPPAEASSGSPLADDTPSFENVTSESTRTLALDISVSDDGKRCFARISVEDETAGEQLGWTAQSGHIAASHDCTNVSDGLIEAITASGGEKACCIPPEPPDSVLHRDHQPRKHWMPPEGHQAAPRESSLNHTSPKQSRSLHTADGHDQCDPEGHQSTPTLTRVSPPDENDQQPLLHSRYDDSAPSSSPSSPLDMAPAKPSSCEQRDPPQPSHSPTKHQAIPGPAAAELTVTFLQERLESKANELSGLREEVRRLRESRFCIDALPSGRGSAEDDMVYVSAAELAAMKKDMEEQEHIITGYGEANRSAAVQVKELETRLKAKDAAMVEERAALERDLVRAVEAQKHRSADTADKLRRILELEAQLAAVREEEHGKQAELRHALEGARQEIKVLEERVSASESQAVQEGDQLVQQVRDEMQTVKAQYDEHVAGLQEKLEWHMQQQANAEARLREQEATVAELRIQVQDQPTIQAAQQQVANLSQQVLELQRGASDGGGGKAAVSRPDAAERREHAEVEALRAELRRTQQKAAETQATAYSQYRALEKRQEQLIAASAAGGDAVAVAAQEEAHRLRQRVQTLQAILDAERGRRPGSGLAESSSTTLEDMTNTPRHSEDGTGGARSSTGLTKQWVRLRQQLAEAKQTISSKDSLLTRLHQQMQQGHQRRDAGAPVPEGQLGGLHKDIQELRGQLDRQLEAQAQLQGDVRAANEAKQRAEQACAESVRQAEAEAADLRLQVAQLTARQEASQVMVAAVQQASAAAAGALQEAKIEYLQKQVDGVIEVASALQQGRKERSDTTDSAPPGVEA
eukprot:jgi/Ulvmu1/8036/UM004_0273.1